MSQLHRLCLVATLVASGPALAGSDDWKAIVKQQANQKMEQELNLPQPAPQGARAYIAEPQNGATLTGPIKVVFGLTNMGVAPAGVNHPGTGHHHLLIDDPVVNFAQPLPVSEQVKHFGDGHTEVVLNLKPGTHTLQLAVGDWKHQTHNPPVLSEKITITVK